MTVSPTATPTTFTPRRASTRRGRNCAGATAGVSERCSAAVLRRQVASCLAGVRGLHLARHAIIQLDAVSEAAGPADAPAEDMPGGSSCNQQSISVSSSSSSSSSSSVSASSSLGTSALSNRHSPIGNQWRRRRSPVPGSGDEVMAGRGRDRLDPDCWPAASAAAAGRKTDPRRHGGRRFRPISEQATIAAATRQHGALPQLDQRVHGAGAHTCPGPVAL